MSVALLKYNAGNIQSVIFALQKLGIEPTLTNDIDLLNEADKIIFPGVGEAGSTMKYLRENKLDEWIKNCQKPLLGICLGMQLLCKSSQENDTECLGIFDVEVLHFPKKNTETSSHPYKVPHVGWNEIHDTTAHPLFRHLQQPDVYFVHSYYVPNNSYSIAECNYILPFCAAMQKNNFYAVQFHPEKSSDAGLQILKNFLEL